MLFEVLALVVGLIAFIFLLDFLRRPKNLPPGPPGLPLIGCVTKLNYPKVHLQLTEWAKQYGGVFSFYMFGSPVIILADLDSMKEALIKHADIFSGRPSTPMARFESNGHGLVMTNGDLFKEQRRFALTTLRDFGFGRPILEGKVMEEVESLLLELGKSSGKPFDVQFLLNNVVSNVICSLIFGRRFEYTDQDFTELLDILNYKISRRGFTFLTPLMFWAELRFLPGIYGEFQKNQDLNEVLKTFLRKLIKEHEATFREENEPEDYIHAFMKAKAAAQGDFFVDEQLLWSVQSLFAAGTETTSTTLRWAIMYMALNPDIQDKVYKEIAETVGINQLPGLTDKPKLPFTEATIMEVQRMANLAPLAVSHETTENGKLMGFDIPKGSMVVPLLWAVHKDARYFPEPEIFKPERFLDGEGKVTKPEAFMPFSIGKRVCLGESLAKMELFLFFASMMQRYRFTFPSDRPKPDPKDTFLGVTITPKPFDIIASERALWTII